MYKFVALLLCFFLPFQWHLAQSQTKYQKDFDSFWSDINDNYAYLDKQQIDWQKVKEIYTPSVAAIDNDDDFIRLLENVLNELHNGHNSLNTNLNTSNKLIPSGADMYIKLIEKKYIIADIRRDFGAYRSGLREGMEIVKYNDQPIDAQLKKFLPKYAEKSTPQMYQYAISMLFAGTHDGFRKITVLENGVEKDFFPDFDHLKSVPQTSLLNYDSRGKNFGFIKINNSLFKNETIRAFDRALDSLIDLKNLILDLTDTPSGGNTTVARAIMGRFIDKMLPYQQHEIDEKQYNTKRHWVEYVLPRGRQFKGKVYVLVGRWTGSMGEGLAIGFDGMKRATVIGTEMAGLLGAISNFNMPETNIGFQFPTERLYHINGTPREDFKPKILTKNENETWITIQKILKY